MRETPELIAVWHPKATIAGILSRTDELAARMPFALITCIDSSREPALTSRLHEEFETAGARCRQLGSYILVPTEAIPKLLDSVLTGFDEIWFLEAEPESVAAAPLSITSECPLTDHWPLPEDLARSLSEWMHTTHAVLGLGDGIGLNILTTDSQLLQVIKR